MHRGNTGHGHFTHKRRPFSGPGEITDYHGQDHIIQSENHPPFICIDKTALPETELSK
jgi:hypothetical protein